MEGGDWSAAALNLRGNAYFARTIASNFKGSRAMIDQLVME
jgi:hypothetical protein